MAGLPIASRAGAPAGTRPGARPRARLEAGLASFIIAVSTGFPLIRTSNLFAESTVRDTNYAEGSITLPLVFGTVFLVAAWLAWMNRATVARNLRAINPFLLLALAWCACSILWSPYPFTTLKRTVQLGGLIMVGLVVAPPLGTLSRFAGTVLATFTTLLLVCMAVSLAIPQIGVDARLDGAWRGIFWHKNVLGLASAFAFLLWLRELRGGRLDWRACVAGGLFSLAMLILAKSTTSLIIAMAGAAIYLFLALRYVRTPHITAIGGLALAAAVLLALHFFYSVAGRLPTWEEIVAPVTAVFNKSPDLTGRMDIWRLVMLEVARHPWVGIGYGAYWLGVGSPSQYAIDILNYIPLQAHNGYLDMLNELGIVGVLLLAGLLAVHTRHLVLLMRIDRPEAAFHAAFFVLILIGNISESILFRGVQFEYVWLVCSSIMVSSRLAMHRDAAGVRRS